MTLVASVIVPVRNEEVDIEGCLRAVAAQDLGAKTLEVIVAEGRSTDGTRAVLQQVGPELGFGRFEVVDNPDGGIAAGLNAATGSATAPVVVRVDARSRVEPHYVRTVVDVLEARTDVGVVGGSQVPVDRGTGLVSAGIARALSNRYTTGLSRYRRGATSGPADTVWMGAFRATELRCLGGWDEALVVNEDYELCERYRASGRLVWFEPSLRSGYLPRAALGALARQYGRFGRAKGRRWRSGAAMSPRHLVLLLTPPTVIALAVSAVRRVSAPAAATAAVAAALAADELGSRERAPVAVRCIAIGASTVTNAAWWLGVLAGFLERPEQV